MPAISDIKEDFFNKRDALFKKIPRRNSSLQISKDYSILVEEFVRQIAGSGRQTGFALASAGSFSRRELSPFSDIDLMFIAHSAEECKEEITQLVTELWDSGIEVSHTVREFTDIEKFLETDLLAFTQFFETRFLLGNKEIFSEWTGILFNSLTPEKQVMLLNQFFADMNSRYARYGDSAKTLEPNVKNSAGGLRDFQAVEWMFTLKHKTLLNRQVETAQAEIFIEELLAKNYTTPAECKRLLESYNLLISVRNLLHVTAGQKDDRFEFNAQKRVSSLFYKGKDAIAHFMRDYFRAATIIHRFSKAMVRIFKDEISNPLPDALAIDLDEDFIIKGRTISLKENRDLSLSDIMRAFYYRASQNAHLGEELRSKVVDTTEEIKTGHQVEAVSSVFFREILRLPRCVGETLFVMNELGVLAAYMPEFGELNGFLQHGVYHYYTADEHTLMTIQNVEKLSDDTSTLGKIFNGLKNREILYLSLLFHDIAKPINIGGHEIIGSEMASSIMQRLGYSEEEIEQVTFLVKNHLVMEQVAFRRNLSDPETLNTFTSRFATVEALNLLYLVTYADLSAVNPAVWTSWKSDLLAELYGKSRSMLEDQMTGEEFLISNTYIVPKEISRHSRYVSEEHVQEHIESINDIAYTNLFSDEEIAQHIEEIQKGLTVSTLFKELTDFTNITVITKDFPSLLSKLCGVLSINSANIHDAKIFTRRDGIVIDTFNVTDFHTGNKIEESRFDKIKANFEDVVTGILKLNQEFLNMKSRWRRIEQRFFKRTGKVKITFEKHDKYTIIDVFSPDRLGFLYTVTNKMNELGLGIYFAKISTRGDDIVDSFYVLDRNRKKISAADYDFIITELTETINQML